MTAVASLAGADLARWVGRLDGADFGPDYDQGEYLITGGHSGHVPEIYNPHEDWAIGGPLIEKHHIETAPTYADDGVCVTGWMAMMFNDVANPHPLICVYGPTLLVAAMRALVASVYGENVPDEVQS